ncbi:glycosyltransferase family 2 protein [Paenibacillus sp. PAMC21692]|uniref:glycosyltransferase family 2 protein n=1 Tax=Paenibacillus sp. PAMC21692 TaxID=2762320 RepID=UPI00164E08C0|nr:glycosyltransferase family 2 protein [Paenibacillus sp. PAMC21692]QNK58171.1 glycosyltransferase family 2 protein [Paenibacillus sp. PAMC21692]
MVVSVIIPTFDRPNTLLCVIDSYIDQEYVGELIIIDDGSSKSYTETIEYIEERLAGTQIIFNYYKNQKNHGAAYCRNLGVELAKYDYILWGEDDAFLSSNYLSVLLPKANDDVIVFGSIYYGITPWMEEDQLIQKKKEQQLSPKSIFDYDRFEGYYRKLSNNDIEVPFGHALILVPKKAYSSIKYYENYKVNGYREESDAQVQMVKNGNKIFYTSDTECYHLPGLAIEKGGQHKKNRLIQEVFTIINTGLFYKRHLIFFNKRYNVSKSVSIMTFLYVKRKLNEYNLKLINKIKRKFRIL